MKLLLDTHVILWFEEDAVQLPETVKAWIENEDNEKFVSIASVWEVAIKVGLGKLILGKPIEDYFMDLLSRNGFTLMPISISYALRVHSLPPYHRDPFDRMLVAQSLQEEMSIVSADPALDAYGLPRLWHR